MPEKPFLVIAGPTASGKSSLAMKIALDFSGEIINADSMQFYKGLDKGTAKPGKDELALVPHHLIDIFDIHEASEVFTYVELAEKAISDIRQRGKLPIIVGGSGMYIRALLYGLDPLPADPVLRAEFDKEYAGDDSFEKLKILMEKEDPEDFQRWRKHQRKLIRALEVFRLTGQSITTLQKTWKEKLRYPAIVWYLDWERETLKQRIRERTIEMLSNGWLEETGKLLSEGILNTPTARQAIGYGIISEYLAGRIDYETMKEKIITSTWHLAKRQITWFTRKHPEAEKIPMPTNYPELCKKLKFKLFSMG
ncbi:MAG: tRNA (adenosine(37)-N6)-dimethylallyltransferase MiaA [Lentisphaerae bacterium GWF2_44_16]|nr:MAG: tRNA (adenosine(37)-N6)-dimethylallyltransferase MiaA [Lentisphaerae bacterium GWF2_44_16]